VEDIHGAVLLDEGASFEDDNVKAMEMVVRSRPRTIRGTVLGDRGEPLRGAAVGVGQTETYSDPSGRFEIVDVYAAEPTLAVSAPRHVRKTLSGKDVFDSPTITLDRGRNLLVHITGPAPEGMEGRAVLQIAGGETYERNKRSPDYYFFPSVPCRPGTLRLLRGTSEVSVAVGAEDLQVEVARP
jgi:hypothetical protein